MLHLEQSPKEWSGDRKTSKKEDEWRQSRRQRYLDRPEYKEESWRLEKTCYHSNYRQKPSANDGMKNSEKTKIIMIWI